MCIKRQVLFARGDFLADPVGFIKDVIDDLIAEEILIGGLGVFYLALVLLALGLTIAMFVTRERLLGFPSGIFWFIFGGYNFILSTATWDIYYFVGFASILGMGVFAIYSAFALREKRDSIGDESMEKGDGGYIDEGKGETTDEGEKGVSERTKKLRDRAKRRRNR